MLWQMHMKIQSTATHLQVVNFTDNHSLFLGASNILAVWRIARSRAGVSILLTARQG